ncbi:solanesyl diphosphate synthase 3, chloroplastic/mitochondrial isoform X3 [Cynara cardunculus var. scolymus]|uniref:solanesyl diphosphate synthase 3, chloroplastic/mitochondrial isoform X3 n=1 Tax=Cynara cardunculus var. scolymus TaxID=59895 RepID=UPI000D6300E9|nr:solanesyl diphosphate synthase 3, chloroplastic/mitochondrial isoform X3 [Cynara cardunculus var. scolymus]
MFSYRGISRISRTASSYNRCRWLYCSTPHQQLSPSSRFRSFMESSKEVLGCRVNYSWISRPFSSGGPQPQYQRSSVEDQVDPFSLVADELSIVANRLRSMVVAEVPKLASAAEYFFKMGVEGKRFRPTGAECYGNNVILLMATALNIQISKPASENVVDMFSTDLRLRQQSIAEITEMIHVASLLHDDVLDDADTRRGIGSLNFVMGNKLAVLAGDFLLSRACITLASLKNTEVVSLIATAVEHLVTGETMQMSTSAEQRSSMDYYLQKTYYKTASLISNSCKSIALLTGQTAEVSMLAYEYGKNLGLAFQLIDDVLDFTGTSSSLGKGALSDIRHVINSLRWHILFVFRGMIRSFGELSQLQYYMQWRSSQNYAQLLTRD